MSVIMEQIALTVQTLYAELLEQCLVGSDPSGSLYERAIKGTKYTYLKAHAAMTRQDYYVGKSDDDTTKQAVELIERANQSLRGRRAIVQMLKKVLPTPHPGLADVVEALRWGGVMSEVVLVGTNAYACYPALVGYRLAAGLMGTDDADLATLNLAISNGNSAVSIEEVLQTIDPSFRALPEIRKNVLPSRFRSGKGFRVDLLTQRRNSRDDKPIPLPQLKAAAMPLQHLAWLIQNPASAVLLSGPGFLVQVPQPARYAIHKLIVAQKRASTERLKRNKDLAQAKSLIEAMQLSDPIALHDAYESASQQGKKGWALPIKNSLKEIGLSIE
jgi:hypothetical protein